MRTAVFLLTIATILLSCADSAGDKKASSLEHPNNHKEDMTTHQDEHHGHGHHTDHNKSNIHMNKSKFEDLVARFEDPERTTWQKPVEVISLFGELEGKRIGDIGAGTGYFSFPLAAAGAEVVAIDVDERFQDYIKERLERKGVGNLSTQLVGYDDPALGEGQYDGLITVNTYHHFNDKVDYMKKCQRGLKNGGKLMIVDFKKEESPHGPPIDHRQSYTEVASDLQSSGFTQIEVDSTLLPYQYIVLAIK